MLLGKSSKHLTMLRRQPILFLLLLSSLLENNFCDALRGRLFSKSDDAQKLEQKVPNVPEHHHHCPASSDDAATLLAGPIGDIGNAWVTNINGVTCVNIAETTTKLKSVDIYYQCSPPPSNNPKLFFHHPDPSKSSWCFHTLKCNGDAPTGYLAFHAEADPMAEVSIHRRIQTVDESTPNGELNVADGGGTINIGSPPAPGGDLFDVFTPAATPDTPEEFTGVIEAEPQEILILEPSPTDTVVVVKQDTEENLEPVLYAPVDPVPSEPIAIALPDTQEPEQLGEVVEPVGGPGPVLITIQEADQEDVILLTSETANEEPVDPGIDPSGSLLECDPYAIANPTILEQAIAAVEADIMLDVHWRRTEAGRLDSFFTIDGLWNLTGQRAWCLDADAPMCIDCSYPFDVCSSYRDDFSDLTQPGGLNNVTNLPEANWLINTYPVNTALNASDPLCPIDLPRTTKVTWRIFQSAIWKLIDQDYHHIINCVDNECEEASDALVACALEHGVTYTPVCCNETIALILAWDDPMTGELSRQELLIEVPLQDIPGVCPEPEPPIPTEPPNYPSPHPTDPCLEECINTTAVEAALIPSSITGEYILGIKFRTLPNTRNDSFFTVDGLLNRTNYAAWCVDVDQYACLDCEWSMDAYSTYDDEGLSSFRNATDEANLPKNFTNFNELNYLMNTFDVGTPMVDTEDCDFDVPNGTVVTWNMMQRAMWIMVDYEFDTVIECDDGTECGNAADQLMQCAFAQGADYVPKCCPNNRVAVLIVWDDDQDAPTRQEIIVEVPVYHIPEACPPEFDFPPLERRLDEKPFTPTVWAKFPDPMSWGGFYCENNE